MAVVGLSGVCIQQMKGCSKVRRGSRPWGRQAVGLLFPDSVGREVA